MNDVSRWGAWVKLFLGVVLLAGAGLLGACQEHQTNYLMSQSQAMDKLAAEPLRTEPWVFGSIPGTKITTEHYQIFTTITSRNPVYHRLLARVLETDFARFVRFNPHTTVTGPLECYVFGDRSQWEYFTRKRMGGNAEIYLQIAAGGYCQEGIFVGYDLGREQTLSVIAHEAWHQYSWYALKDHLPSWLEEGLATQNEAIEWEGTTPVFVPEQNLRRFRALREALVQKRLWPIEELVRVHAGQAIRRQQRDIDAYYGQLWSLTLFLEHSHYRPALLDMMRRATEGQLTGVLNGQGVSPHDITNVTEHWNEVAGPAYLKAYIAADVPKLEREYQQFISDLTSSWPPKLPQ